MSKFLITVDSDAAAGSKFPTAVQAEIAALSAAALATKSPLLTTVTVLATNAAPTKFQSVSYDATGGALTVPLAALSTLTPGDWYAVQRYQLDTSGNAITFTANGSDVFDSGSASQTLPMPGELRYYTVVTVDGVKKWKVTNGNTTVSGNDNRYIPGIYIAKNYGAKGNAVVTTGGIALGAHALSKASGNFVSGDVGKTVVVPGAGVTRTVTDGAITTGTAILTSATAAFTSADVRSVVTIAGAGAAGATLTATIIKVSSSGQVTISVNASTTVSGASTTVTAYLMTTIASVSSGVATLAGTAAGRTVSGATFIFGTDDTAAINAAITACNNAGGGTVLFPPANYLTSGFLQVYSNVTYTGGGQGNTVIYKAGGTSFAAFWSNNVYTLGSPCISAKITDITVDGLYTQHAFAVGSKGISVEYNSACTFQNLTIQNTLATGLAFDYATNNSLALNCRLLYCGAGSLQGSQGGGCSGIGQGTGQSAMNEQTIAFCHAVGCGNYGIFLETQTGTMSRGIKVIGCTAEGNGLAGFCDAGGDGTIWSNCYSYNNLGIGFANSAATIAASIPGQNTQWLNCEAVANGQQGFLYTPLLMSGVASTTQQPNATGGVSWKNCKSISNGLHGFAIVTSTGTAQTVPNIEVDCCEARMNGSTGLLFSGTGTVKNVVVNGGTFSNNGQISGTDHYGVRINCTANKVRIRGIAAYDDGGTQKQTHGLALTTGFTITDIIAEGNDLQGNLTAATTIASTLAGNVVFRNNAGYNPVGSAVPGAAWALPASAVAWTNNTGVDVFLQCTAAGTTTAVAVGFPTTATGVSLAGVMAVGNIYPVPANGTFKVTYSVAPTLIMVGQ